MVAIMAFAAACSEPSNEPTQSLTRAPATSTDVPSTAAPELKAIVATSNIIGEWISIVGGDRVEVTSLVPRQADPHAYQPGASDVSRVANADAIFTVGHGLASEWLTELLENASTTDHEVIALSEEIDALPFAEIGDVHDEDVHDVHDEHDGHGEFDPHFWFDPTRVKEAVHLLAHELSEIEPLSAGYFEANADAYSEELDELDGWIFEQVALIDRDERKLLTSHEVFGYFADRYGFEVVGVIIPGGGTEIEPTPSELAELSDSVREHGVNVIFDEVQLSGRLAQTLAREAGIEVVDDIHTGSLSAEGTEAGTYIGMMRHNVDVIVGALK